MRGSLRIHQLQVSCVIGCLPEEREQEQTIHIDVEWGVELSEKDRLEETTDYVVVAKRCEDVAVLGRYHLIESLAKALMDSLVKDLSLERVKLRVRKPSALPHARWTEIELSQEGAL